MLEQIVSMIVSNPVTAGIVVAVISALVVVGLKVAEATKNTVDDSIFGFLASLLGLRKPSPPAPPSDPAAGASAPLMRARPLEDEPAEAPSPEDESGVRPKPLIDR